MAVPLRVKTGERCRHPGKYFKRLRAKSLVGTAARMCRTPRPLSPAEEPRASRLKDRQTQWCKDRQTDIQTD